MKKNIYYLFIFISIFGISCDKVLLDIKDTDLILGDVALTTTANCESALLGGYAGVGANSLILFNAVISDEVRTNEFYNAQTVHEWLYGTADVGIRDNYQVMPPYYQAIDRVNRVLRALPAAKKNDINVSDSLFNADKKRIEAECLFLRAYLHFELYRFFSNSANPEDLAMYYITEPSLLGKFPRDNVSVYFTKLKQDIADAKAGMPSLTFYSNRYRANTIALAGLEARVALYLKDYPTAIAASTVYINAIPLATTANFAAIWTDANRNTPTECAYVIPYSTGNRLGNLFRGNSANASQVGTVTWSPSFKLTSSYDSAKDVRYNNYFTYQASIIERGAYPRLIKKYAGTAYGTANENVNDYKVMRTAEMYLIRAEANAETNNLNQAAADLNALRTNRITGYTNATFATKDDLISGIITERFKELCYEGNRTFDLKRRNLPIERLQQDIPTNSTALTLPAGNFRFVLPIYITEIQANPNIQQNTGY